jgi:hypothetical protein
LHGVEAASAKFQKISEDDFWDSTEDSSLLNTASKAIIHRPVVPEISTFGSLYENPSNPAFDAGNIDSILNRVRPGIKLNRVQSSVKDCIFYSNENAVIGAPTGTILFMHERIGAQVFNTHVCRMR